MGDGGAAIALVRDAAVSISRGAAVRDGAPLRADGLDVEAVDVAIIGAGPAGLAAAETASANGARVVVFDWTPSPARKFLMAGKSGLNITNAAPFDDFLSAFGEDAARLRPMLAAFGPEAVARWCEALGQPVFEGGGRRVFPKAMKASPLLRAWLSRLTSQGVEIRRRWRWTGWAAGQERAGALTFETPEGPRGARPLATVLAAGGASWPRLGSDAAWGALVRGRGVPVTPFQPSNVGFEIGWSEIFRHRFAGAPVKAVRVSAGGASVRGEFVVTDYGVEGGAIYALGRQLRAADVLTLDLAPGLSVDALTAALARQPSKASLSNRLRKAARLDGVKAGLLREAFPDLAAVGRDPAALAARIKAAPLTLVRPRPIAEAISSAGGVAWSAMNEQLMLRSAPGVFCAGEMIDWDAPTGGYLLSACLATGRWAGAAAAAWAACGAARGEEGGVWPAPGAQIGAHHV